MRLLTKESAMAEITAAMVKDLREKTGAGMMDCKKALTESAGDTQKAEEWLRVKGITKAGSKESRVAAEGLVGSYIHMGGKIGVLVEINSESDFVARNEEFQQLVKDVAMHIAASNPSYVRREEIPEAAVANEREVQRSKLKEEGKSPEKMWDKILEGKMNKWYQDVCLVDQPFVKDPDKTVGQLVTEKVARIGEKLSVRRFVRFQVGEGIEKKQTDFAAEVQQQVQAARA
jgi:elongation factor Ts